MAESDTVRVQQACARPARSIQYGGQCWPLDEAALSKLKRLEGAGRNDFARRVVLIEMGYNVEHLEPGAL